MIPEDKILEVQNAVDIIEVIGEYLPLTRSGRLFTICLLGMCVGVGRQPILHWTALESLASWGLAQDGKRYASMLHFHGSLQGQNS